ncbi:hypothetical protein EBT31_01120 [bacterium]|nr:hypothetical protein [bacterium]
MTDRTPRDLLTRENQTRKRTWRPPSLLPDPKAQDGYSFRWLRTSILGQSDARNIASKRAEGWELVNVEEHPELQSYGAKAGNLEIGGLVLAKSPTDLVEQRNEYYAQMNAQADDAVNNNLMRENDPRMPLFSERSSTTSRGRR